MADLRQLAAVVLRNLRARGLASDVNADTVAIAHSIFTTALRDASLILMPLVPIFEPPAPRGDELRAPTLKDYAGITDQLAGIELRLASIAERLERTESIDMATKTEVTAALRAAIVDQGNLRMSIENMIHAFSDQVQAAADGGNMDDVKSLVDDLRSGAAAIATDVMANTPAAHLAGPAAEQAPQQRQQPAPAAPRTLDTTTAQLPSVAAEGETFIAHWTDGGSTPLTYRAGQWLADDGSGSIDPSGTWVPTPAPAGGGAPQSTNPSTQGTGPAAGAAGNLSGAGVA
jgi:hypothetical protein